MNSHDCITPLDSRYRDEELAKYLSDRAFLRYKLRAEQSLVEVFQDLNFCSAEVVDEISEACSQVLQDPGAVDREEKRVRHDIRALVNCIQARVSPVARPFVHLAATSYDIVDTANAARFRDVTEAVLLPRLHSLHGVLCEKAEVFADTVQVGRTHGQHAIPVTLGFVFSGYASRLQGCIHGIEETIKLLPGKLSGAVGAYNALFLIFPNPQLVERLFLEKMGLVACPPSTQIVQPEPRIRFMLEVCLSAGVMADMADDMRHLQRSEIGEIGEYYGDETVGSSTMPQKRNPISFENVKSVWKLLNSRFQVLLLDQLSEHQRDLTNSASSRAYGEFISYAALMAKRMESTLGRIAVDCDNLDRNLALGKGMTLAEPLYILLAVHGHPDAHEAVRRMTQKAIEQGMTFSEAVQADDEMISYLRKMSPWQREMLEDVTGYTGLAQQIAEQVKEEE